MFPKIAPVWYVIFLLALAVHLSYSFWLHDELVVAFHTTDHPWIAWLGKIYPSLEAKLSQGKSEQILERADSFIWRIWLMAGFSWAVWQYLPKLLKPTETSSTAETKVLLSTWWWVQTLFVLDLYIDVIERSHYAGLFTAIWPWGILFPSFPHPLVLHGLMGIYCLGFLTAIFSRYSYGIQVSWFVFLLFQVIQLGFGKLEHTYISFTFAGFWLTFFHQTPNQVYRWLARLSIGLSYFFAGLEKLLIAGLSWWTTGTLTQLIPADSVWLPLFTEQVWLEPMLLTGVILFQLSAPLLAISNRYYWVFACLALAFHLGTFLILGVGGLVSPWLAALLLFIIPDSSRRKPV